MHPGPMNRGVEIDPRVADSAAALVSDQVRAGLVVRMAVLYDLLTGSAGNGAPCRTGGGRLMLVARNGHSDSLTSRVVCSHPAQGIDDSLRITVTDGVISAIEPGQARSLVLAPALRRPARPPAHPGPRGRGDDRARGQPPPPPAATARSSRCRTPSPWSTPRPFSARSIERAREQAVVPVGLHGRDQEGPARGGADRDGRARRHRRGRASRTTAGPSSPPG